MNSNPGRDAHRLRLSAAQRTRRLSSTRLYSQRGQHDEIRALRELARRQADQLSTIRRLAYRAHMAFLDHDLELLRNILIEMADVPDPDPRQLELPYNGSSPRADRGGYP